VWTDHDLHHLAAGLCRAVTNGSMHTTRASFRRIGLGAEPVQQKHSIIRWAIVHGSCFETAEAASHGRSQRLLGSSATWRKHNYRLLLRCFAERMRDEAGATPALQEFRGHEVRYF
jgi:hypothetical protein